MTVINRIVKPTTHRGKRAILKKEPKLIENIKQILCFKSKKNFTNSSRFYERFA
uniref:Brix domain containing 1 n=1 Tax=Apis cerana TaxID=7461 RepID=V9IF69_APICE